MKARNKELNSTIDFIHCTGFNTKEIMMWLAEMGCSKIRLAPEYGVTVKPTKTVVNYFPKMEIYCKYYRQGLISQYKIPMENHVILIFESCALYGENLFVIETPEFHQLYEVQHESN